MTEKICQQCKQQFEVTAKDREFLEMLKVPDPTFCPQCRLIRRLVFRNERSLYKRQCDLCTKESIMQYSSDAPFPVYCKTCWYSDGWDAQQYAREYDFSKPFFKQMHELMLAVPRLGHTQQGTNINSEYTNRVGDLKNCYLIFGTSNAENSRYGAWLNFSKECQDCYATVKSERCAECIDSTNCYNLAYSSECTNCRDSKFLHNCTNMSNSFGCVNLRNKQFCLWNEQYTKEEYEKKIAELNLASRSAVQKIRGQFNEFKKQFIVPAMVTRRSVDSTGNWLEDCKDATESFNCQNVERIRHCFSVFSAKDSMDHTHWSNVSERIYEGINVGLQCANVRFAHECWIQILDSEYVMNCMRSKNLFGCVGIRDSEYCILNKQYSKESFGQLRAKIIEQMNTLPYIDVAGREYRYGEFYPIELAPFCYNESLSQEFFPMSKEEAAALCFPWRESEERHYKITMPFETVPDSVKEVTDDILKEVIGCAHAGPLASGCKHQCTTAFRVVPEELQMYRIMQLPLPTLCPNCRHFGRLARRNPMKLWQRSCQCLGKQIANSAEQIVYKNTAEHAHGNGPCQNKFETSYAPNRPEKVYCIDCYQQEIV